MRSGKLDVKGIMFDLDGTLLDTRPAYVEAAKIAFKTTGYSAPNTAQMLQIPKLMEQKQSLSGIVQGNTKTFLAIYLKVFYSISASKTRLLPNVATTLETLSQKARLAVITMRFMPGEAIRSELDQFQVGKYFAHVVTALDTPRPKPSPEALIKAVAAMDVQMCECIIVGDSTVDVQAGKAAGAKTVGVLSGLYTRAELAAARPDYIINDASELPALLV